MIVSSLGSNSEAGWSGLANVRPARRPSVGRWVHRLFRAEPEHLHRLGQLDPVLFRHLVARVDVEDQLVNRAPSTGS